MKLNHLQLIRILQLTMLYLGTAILSPACDNCGCFMGITPYDNQSSIGLFYRYRSYSGYSIAGQSPEFFPKGRLAGVHSALHDPHENEGEDTHAFSDSDYEIYNVFELRTKYFIHQRIELNIILPYNENKIHYENATIDLKSIGDVSVLAGYHLIRQIETEHTIQQRPIIGTGIKLPSGKYDFRSMDGSRYNFLLQPGTGSIDYLFYLNYMAAGKKFGLGLSSVYKVCTENNYNEKFAGSNNTSVSLFYKLYRWNWQLVPSVQLYYEYVKGMKEHGALSPNTGSDIAMLGPVADLYYKNFALTFAVYFPVRDKTDRENLSAAGKMVAGLKYNFNQNKFLIHKNPNNDNL